MIDKQDHNYFMCSFDIKSLFINVPLEETIEVVIKNVFGRKRKINGLSKSDFQDLLKSITMSTVFYFNGNYYKQLDGVAIGSPFGPALANAFYVIMKTNGLEDVQLHMLQFFISVTSMTFLFC